jgi:hypothetical protein
MCIRINKEGGNKMLTPQELYGKIRIFEPACDEVIPANIKRDNEACIKLIQQAKAEWCKQQRESCADEYKRKENSSVEWNKNLILNTPTPI